MSCIYINKCPSCSGWCLARNGPKEDCAGFLITAYENLESNILDKICPSRVYRKPPLGVKPRFLHDKERMEYLQAAIVRYADAGFTIPSEWVDELTELCERYPENKYNSFL